MISGVNPTILYICLTILAIAAMAGVYFKILPVELVIAIVGVLIGHGLTLASVRRPAIQEQMGHVTLPE